MTLSPESRSMSSSNTTSNAWAAFSAKLKCLRHWTIPTSRGFSRVVAALQKGRLKISLSGLSNLRDRLVVVVWQPGLSTGQKDATRDNGAGYFRRVYNRRGDK